MAMQMLGRAVSEALSARMRTRIEALAQGGVTPKRAIVRCGDKLSDIAYETIAKRQRNIRMLRIIRRWQRRRCWGRSAC